MKSKGFTLVELMIVIAIISILATIIIPKMSQARDRSKLAACKSNLRHLGVAAEMYANDNGHLYPPSGKLKPGNCLLVDPTLGYFKNGEPVCPANPAPSAATSYGLVSPADYRSYYIYCRAGTLGYPTHTVLGLANGFPQYDSVKGLIEH